MAGNSGRIKTNIDELRIVLVGKSGTGKSTTGNTILGRKCFQSKFSARSRTLDCFKEGTVVDGQQVAVIDTPGLFDTRDDMDKIEEAVGQCIRYISPGPHVFLVVIRLGRYSEEEKLTVQIIQENFGQAADRYTMVLFTGGDLLDDEPFEDFLSESPDLHQLVTSCYGQYHVFNNKLKDPSQVSELLQKIRNIVEKNGGSHYTNEMFQEAERNIEEEKQRILKEKEIIRKEREEQKKIEEEKQRILKERDEEIRKEREEQKKKIEEEKQRILKERDEEIQKEREEQKKKIEEEKQRILKERDEEIQTEREEQKKKIEEEKQRILKERDEEIQKEREEQKKKIEEEKQRILKERDEEIQKEREEQKKKIEEEKQRILKERDEEIQKEREEQKKKIEEEKQRILKERDEEIKRGQIKTNNEELRIMLVGKSGTGKSAAGNTILGRKCFQSKFSFRSTTVDCSKGKAVVDGQQVAVIDNPGLFDTRFSAVETFKYVGQCIAYASPGPHVFLVVIKLGRYTEEEKQIVQRIQEIFGQAADRYTMVLFTGGDLLDDEPVEDFLSESPDLHQLVTSCYGQYHVFNNKLKDPSQVSELLQKIRNIVEKNGGSHYTNEMFQEAERKIEEEKQRILKERDEEIQKEREELQRELQENMKKR